MDKESRLFWATIFLTAVTMGLCYFTVRLYDETVQLRSVTEKYAASFKETGETLSIATGDIKNSTASLPSIKDALEKINSKGDIVELRLKEATDAITKVESATAKLQDAITAYKTDVADIKKNIEMLESDVTHIIDMKYSGKW